MTRIAIHRVCGIGDAAQITPLLQQIRADCPDGHLTLFISENAAPVLYGAPWLDELVSLPKAVVTPSWHNLALWRMWRQIAANGCFDLFLHLGARWRDAIGSIAVSASVRAGLSTASTRLPQPFETIEPVPADPLADSTHASAHYLHLWQRITGLPDRGFRAALPHLGRSEDISRWQLPARCIAIAPGSGNWLNPAFNKRWPSSHWKRFMEYAISSGYNPVLLGVEGDLPSDKHPPGAISLLGRVTLEEAAAILRHCIGFAGHDSGLFHLALALGIRSMALFGPTRPDLTGPFRQPHALVLRQSLPCVPCCSDGCTRTDARDTEIEGTPLCMNSISPSEAWQQTHAFYAA